MEEIKYLVGAGENIQSSFLQETNEKIKLLVWREKEHGDNISLLVATKDHRCYEGSLS